MTNDEKNISSSVDSSDCAVEPAGQEPAHIDYRSAEERTAALLKQMTGRRKVLLALLAFCKTPEPVAKTEAYVEDLQSTNHSVYSAASLCALLEDAGALVRETENGVVFNEDNEEPTPQTVVIDGVEYLEPRPAPELFWHTTKAGLNACAADDDSARLRTLLAKPAEQIYLPIYERVLTLCAQEGGAATRVLADAVDKDPLVQEPRLFVQRFVERLEQCDALVWSGSSWNITPTGEAALEAGLTA